MSASRTTSALVPYAGRPSQEVMETLAATVSKNTRAGYTRESVCKFHYLALRQRCWRIHPGFGVGIPPPSQYKRCGDESTKKQKESTVSHKWACIKSEWCGSKRAGHRCKRCGIPDHNLCSEERVWYVDFDGDPDQYHFCIDPCLARYEKFQNRPVNL